MRSASSSTSRPPSRWHGLRATRASGRTRPMRAIPIARRSTRVPILTTPLARTHRGARARPISPATRCTPRAECPDPDSPACPEVEGRPDPDNPACPDTTVSAGGPGPGGPSADDDGPDDVLAFTGADLGTLGAIGVGIMAIGLAL